MTFAPQSIADARAFLLQTFNAHPGNVSGDLEADEVGIVGDPAHRGGYHCGNDRLNAGSDYSVVQSTRDRHGLSGAASALDVGQFDQVHNGVQVTLLYFNAWLVSQCKGNASDTLDIREVIYSPDGKTVRRWDRLGHSTSGDSSHLSHTHISYFRDSESRSKRPLFERFAREIGADMDAAQSKQLADVWYTLTSGPYGAEHTRWNTAMTLLQAIASKVDIDPTELDAVRAAAREGAVSASDDLVAAVLAHLPTTATLTHDVVEQAVRDAFASGLAGTPDTP